MLKVGQEVTARVIKIDKSDRRIGLSIKAANYSDEQLKAEQAAARRPQAGRRPRGPAARLRRRRRGEAGRAEVTERVIAQVTESHHLRESHARITLSG